MDLNENQKIACKHFIGPALVIAGAGSGKTHVITSRIEYLISQKNVDPSSILAITFTNYAANQMQTRLEKKYIFGPLICTFHKLGLNILRKACSNEECVKKLGRNQNFAIYDDKETSNLIKNIIAEYNLDISSNVCMENIGKIKNGKSISCNETTHAFNQYEKELIKNNAFDLDDLCFVSLKVLEEMPSININKWNFVCVDEFQDTSPIQSKIAKHIAGKNLFVVGDPDQSIYSWRGASIQNIINLPEEIKDIKTITLDQNYRSTNVILQASNHLISNNKKRFSKDLWSNISGEKHIHICSCKNEIYEAKWIAEKIELLYKYDIAILYRTNYLSRSIEDILKEKKIPYKILGGTSFYDRKEIKDLISFLKLSINPKDSQSFYRILKNMSGFGKAFIKKIESFSQENNLDILEAIENIHSYTKTNEKQKIQIEKFILLIKELKNTENISTCIKKIIESSIFKLDDPVKEREENINELLSKSIISKLDKTEFIDKLLIEQNTLKEKDQHFIKLMTVHHSKGSEFDYVFIMGTEDGIFPHSISFYNEDAIEEERRLFYVAMTRAKKNIFITFSNKRLVWGQKTSSEPSRFIYEIPQNLMEFNFYPQYF